MGSGWIVTARALPLTRQGSGNGRGTVKSESEVVKQCAVMFVNPVRERTPHPEAMRAMGFVVHESHRVAHRRDAAVRDYHVVIVRVSGYRCGADAGRTAPRQAALRTPAAHCAGAAETSQPIGAPPRRAGSTRS